MYKGALFELNLSCLFLELLNFKLQLNDGIREAVEFFFPFLPLKLPHYAMVTLLVRVTLLRRLGCLNKFSVGRLDLSVAV